MEAMVWTTTDQSDAKNTTEHHYSPTVTTYHPGDVCEVLIKCVVHLCIGGGLQLDNVKSLNPA